MTESTSEYKKRIEEIKQSIENEPYMAKMREDIAEGISKTGIRQATVEKQFQDVLDETTGKDVISAPELIAARNGELNLKTRLDKEKQEVTAQLAQKANQSTVDNLASSKVDKGGNEQISWAMADQHFKEQITGGTTAVVGINSVNTTNVVDKAITFKKLAGDVTGIMDHRTTFTYVDGRLTQVTNLQGSQGLGETKLTYDSDGKLNTIVETIGRINDTQTLKSTLNYKEDGSLSYIEKEVLT